MNKRTVAVIGLIFIGAAVVAFMLSRQGRTQGSDGASEPPASPVSVRVVQVYRADLPRLASAIGTVQSLQNALLRTQIDGVLTRVLVKEGQRVQQGQLLAQIDDSTARTALQQASATRKRDEASLLVAQLNLERYRNLLKGQAIARQAVDEQAALVEQLRATLSGDDAAIQAAQVQLSHTRIVSPLTGRVGMRRIDAGNVVHVSDADGLFSVVQVDPISVIFALPQQDLVSVQPLLAEPERVEVEALDRDAGTRLATGKLMAFDNQVDSATGTFQLRAVFPNLDGRLWHGQFVTVQLATAVDRGATIVDTRAVQRREGGNYVFRVHDGRAQVVAITVGHEQGAAAVINEGLSPGDTVVVDGQSQLVDGAAVKIVSGDNSEGEGAAQVDITS